MVSNKKTENAPAASENLQKTSASNTPALNEIDLQVVLNHAQIGMILIDRYAKIIDCNDAAGNLIGRSRDQILGKPFGVCFCCVDHNNRDGIPFFGGLFEGCELKTAVDRSLFDNMATSDIESNMVILKNGVVGSGWFRMAVTPIEIGSGRYATVTMVNITDTMEKQISHARSQDYAYHFLDQIPVIIWKSNPRFETTYVSKGWDDFAGIPREQAMETGWSQVIHPDDLARSTKIGMEALSEHRSYQLEARLRLDGENYRWCILSAGPIFDLDGKLEGFAGLIHDISELKAAEEGAKRYQLLTENTKDIIVFIDMDGRILDANQAAVNTYGYTYEELLNINVRDIREDWECTGRQMKAALEHGLFFETIHRRKDGSYLSVEVSSQGVESGGKKILLSVVRDITIRKKTERALQISRARYESLLDNMLGGYVYYKMIYNSKGIPCDAEILEVNEAFEKLTGLYRGSLIGKRHSEVFASLDKLLNTLDRYRNEIRRYGSAHIEEIYLEPFKCWCSLSLYSPEPQHVVAIIRDISYKIEAENKLKKATAEAEAANRAKSEFLASMSHEIRTPINGMVGMVDLTLMTELNPEQRENLKTAKLCASALLKIINDILDFSKLEAGRFTIEKVCFNLEELMEAIRKIYEPRFEEKNLSLIISLPETIPIYLRGDPYRLRQVLCNLIGNALKFTENGTIMIKISKLKRTILKGVRLKFEIIDTGIGISYDEMKKIFQSFSQVDGKTSGTGLGLVISKKLIELMGGRINVTSKKGKGSNFYFTLEFEQAGLEQYKKKSELVPSLLVLKRPLKVLLADDDPVSRAVMSKFFEKLGGTVFTAQSGKEAVELFRQSRFDLVLMDIRMAEMDGIEAAEELRKLEQLLGHTPMIAMTAYALKGVKESLLAAGFDDYISKPVNFSELYSMISRMKPRKPYAGDHRETLEELVPMEELLHFQGGNLLYLPLREGEEGCLEAMLDELAQAAEKHKFSKAESLAHALKTELERYGSTNLKDAAFKAELAARRKDSGEIKILTAEMTELLKACRRSADGK